MLMGKTVRIQSVGQEMHSQSYKGIRYGLIEVLSETLVANAGCSISRPSMVMKTRR